ncbi:MAG: Protease PrsW [Alphaproteobacteria bacterium MarineAlpha2_Bin1]|nr:MAG: Protease PrsW [Alphaproteobacteria bacterium MarineAlpha2_Bin1]|tara:strand:+ start:209 stop:862 length:654 start_codon:yes stop_codon:yes gene_type:complete
MFVTLLFTILPSILIMLYVIFSDRFREPYLNIIYAFILGFIIIIPAGFLNYYFIFSNQNPEKLVFIAGFTEEIIKFVTLFFFLKGMDAFNEHMDSIVYATLLSLGFATLENFDYVFFLNQDISSLTIAILRAFTAIPLHACCGIIMGYFFGLYVFKKSNLNLILSLVIPITIHSFYNFISGNTFLYIFILLVIVYAISLHRKVIRHQKTKIFEQEND